MVEFRLLRSFVTLAEELHFGRAAKRLNISQPPLSRQIAQLEEEVGASLFERTKRRVELTAAGRVLYERTRANLASVEHSLKEAVSVSRGEIGRITVGLVGSAAYGVLPQILSAFRAIHPSVEFRFHAMTTTQQIRALLEKRIDIGLVRTPLRNDGIDVHHLAEENLILAIHASHPLASQSAISIKMLAGEPLLISPREDAVGYHDEVIALCNAAGFTPRIACEAQPFSTLIGLVAAGLGLAIVPAALKHIRLKQVVYRPFIPNVSKTAFALAVRSSDKTPLVNVFIETAKETASRSKAKNKPPLVSRDQGP